MIPKQVTVGYVVCEYCEEYEQFLGLKEASDLPKGGILMWSSSYPPYLFKTRNDAKEAVNRTEHYRLAFGLNNLPEKQYCKVIAVVSKKEEP